MDVGGKIKKFRKMRGLTQVELADLLNKHEASIGKYEGGQVKPSLDLIQEIAEVLEVDPLVLLDDEYKPREEKNNLMSIKFILKNGCSFTTKCENFTVNKNGFGQVVGFDMTGIEENKPIYVDLEEIVAIVRTISDEEVLDE